MVEDTVFRSDSGVHDQFCPPRSCDSHADFLFAGRCLCHDSQDNGVGFDQLQVGYGLKQMRERVSILGGRIEFANRNGFYTRIELPKEKGGKIL